MTQKELGYVELEWTCKHCGTVNPGMKRVCTNCGAPMAQDDKFELPGQQALITDQARLAEAKAGPTIQCPYCNVLNPADAKVCRQCGGDIQEGLRRKSGEVLGAYQTAAVPDINCPLCGQPVKANAARCPNCGGSLVKASGPETPAPPTPPKKARSWLLIAGIGLGVIAIAAVIVFIVMSGRTNEISATVADLRWQRSIEVLEMQPVSSSTWEEDLPAEAQNVACRDQYKETSSEPVPNATEACGTPYTVDAGSGAGQVVQDCEYRVYASYCDFTTLGLVVVNTSQALGSDNQPYWPLTNLQAGQQEGSRIEAYRVTFSAGGQSYLYDTSDALEFGQYSLGSQWLLDVNTFGKINAVRTK